MKRDPFAALRRGLDNTVANWGLILIRLAEALLLTAIAGLAVVAVLVPILVSLGVRFDALPTPEDVENLALAFIEQWVLLLWIFAALCVVTIVLAALHSFVQAGCARVNVDADRTAGPAVEGPRARFRVFSAERWYAGAKEGWWVVFWIYNIGWGLAGLLFLVPLIPTLILMLLLRDNPAVAIVIGVVGLIVSVVVMVGVGFVTGMWTNRAIADWAARRTGARDSLASAWSAIKGDVGRHLLVAFAMLVIATAGSSFFASFSLFGAFGRAFEETAVLSLVTLPMRLVGTLLSSIFSAFVTSWGLAAYASLAAE